MWLVLLLGVLGAKSSGTDIVARCDLIELNHRFNSVSGFRPCDQLIFYCWSPEFRRYDVMESKCVSQLSHYPYKTPRGYESHMTIAIYKSYPDDDFDGYPPMPHLYSLHVYAPAFVETWTSIEPANRNPMLLPYHHRQPLFEIPR